MKQCPRCQQTYSDDQLNFCLNDGELLTGYMSEPPPARYVDDSPTVMLNPSRVTDPTNWPQTPPSAPPAQWQGRPMNAPMSQFAQYPMAASPNQTLAVVSLGLGVAGVTIGWCCSLGVVLSPAAMITGFIALSQIKKDPAKNGGRGLAIGGIATGAFFIAVYLLILLIYGAAIIGGGLSNIR